MSNECVCTLFIFCAHSTSVRLLLAENFLDPPAVQYFKHLTALLPKLSSYISIISRYSCRCTAVLVLKVAVRL